MAFGGTRFARPKRSRAAPRVIDVDVDVRPPHKTLYEVLVVPPTTSSRQIRKIARALRRNLPHMSDLDDVCLAEQVLGRRDLRAEYDALLARARAAKLTVPQIGTAIEGSRPAAPPAAPPSPAPFASVGRASADAEGEGGKLPLRGLAAIAVLVVGIVGAGVGKGGRHETGRYRTPELQPIELHKFEVPTIDIPRFDPHELGLPKIKPEKREIDRAEPRKRAPSTSTPPKPRKADPATLETP